MPLKTLKEVYDAYALFGNISRADAKSWGLDNRNYVKVATTMRVPYAWYRVVWTARCIPSVPPIRLHPIPHTPIIPPFILHFVKRL